MVDEFNECVQLRFQTPPSGLDAEANGVNPRPGRETGPSVPGRPELLALGMSRIAVPPSFGEHLIPRLTSTRDFNPERPRKTDAIFALETESVQVGMYVFGRAIVRSAIETMNYRALKGPAAITAGTPRPVWYPTGANTAETRGDALPDW